jgi:hypothetical protein
MQIHIQLNIDNRYMMDAEHTSIAPSRSGMPIIE